MKIPFIDLSAQHRSIRNELNEAIEAVIDSSQFVLGQSVSDFEKAFAAYCDVNHCVGVNNGTNALLLTLKALDIGPGDEVITAANTFVATVEAIVHAGARPVLVDVDPDTRTIDPALIRQALSRQSRAIIPVHLYGHPATMDPIREIAYKHDLALIEDAAQAHGARYRQQPVGSLGIAAAFSFYPSKNLGALGEAGAVTTNDPDLAERVRLLRDHGSSDKNRHELIGYNARMEGIQGAVLSVKLKYLDQWNDARRTVAGWYRELLSRLPVKLPSEDAFCRHVHHLYVIETERRDDLRNHLERHGVRTMIHYPTPIHLQPAYDYLGYRAGEFPVTEHLAKNILSLPIYPELTRAQVEYMCDRIGEFFGARS